MFLPRNMTDKANKYVAGLPEDREPRFKKHVGIPVRPSGDILRFTSQTPTKGRRVTAVAAAMAEAEKGRQARKARQVVAQAFPRQRAADAIARIARAGGAK